MARVSAEIEIEAEVTPQLEPDVVANLRIDPRLEARSLEGAAECRETLRFLACRLTEPVAIAIGVLDHAGRHDLGRGINSAADRSLRPDGLPLAPPRIDALELQVRVLALEAVEVPPRNTVLRRDDGGVLAQKRLDLLGRLPSLVRLERDDDVVLVAQLRGIVRRRHLGDLLFAADEELEAVLSDGLEVGPSRDEGDIDARSFHQHANVGADGAGPENTDLHDVLPDRLFCWYTIGMPQTRLQCT